MSSKNRNRPVINNNTAQIQQQPMNNTAQLPEGQDDAPQEQAPEDGAGTEQQQPTDQGTEQVAQAVEKPPEPPVQAPVPEQRSIVDAAPLVHKPQQGFTPVYKVQLDLTSYAEAMDKKVSIVPEEGGKWQYSLFTTIKSVLSAKTQEEFNQEWNTILTFFHQNKDGIFNENFIFRFPHQWPGSNTEFTSFRRIIFLLLQTADVKTRRKALPSINLELVTEGLNQAQRTRLLNFYEA